MKILVVHNAYQSHQLGGEDIIVKQEFAGLTDILGEDKVFQYSIGNDDIRFGPLLKNIWGDKNHYQQIFNLVKKHNIEIVHVHNFFPLLTPSVFAGAKAAGAKVVHTLHNFRWWCSSGILYRKEKGICEQCINKKFGWPAVVHGCYRGSKMQSLAANLAFFWYKIKKYGDNIDAYFVLSQFQQQKLSQLLPAKKLFLKPNVISKPNNSIAKQHKRDFLFVGRLEEAKGIELLLSTWEKLPKGFKLKVIGTGNNLLEQRYKSDNIQFLGKLPHDQVLTHMMHAKYFIHSSLAFETFGLTALEALSVGTPVIAINRGPRAEYIQSDKNGFLGEPHELKDMILKAYDYADYEVMSQQAFESAKPFYAENVLAKQVALYLQILSAK
ncbi:MAG: glycosyltransferase family 4 protein [Proteobacteria bacterium]|nr:glycosyltransferase family 4 protein [Pseudomonadota bacterium]